MQSQAASSATSCLLLTCHFRWLHEHRQLDRKYAAGCGHADTTGAGSSSTAGGPCRLWQKQLGCRCHLRAAHAAAAWATACTLCVCFSGSQVCVIITAIAHCAHLVLLPDVSDASSQNGKLAGDAPTCPVAVRQSHQCEAEGVRDSQLILQGKQQHAAPQPMHACTHCCL